MTYKSHPACAADDVVFPKWERQHEPHLALAAATLPVLPASPHHTTMETSWHFCCGKTADRVSWEITAGNTAAAQSKQPLTVAEIRRLSLCRLSPQRSMNRSLFTQAALWSSLSVTQTHSALHQGIFSFCFLFKTLGHKGCSSSHTTETKSWGRAKKKKKEKEKPCPKFPFKSEAWKTASRAHSAIVVEKARARACSKARPHPQQRRRRIKTPREKGSSGKWDFSLSFLFIVINIHGPSCFLSPTNPKSML